MNLIYAVIDDLEDCENAAMRDLVKYSLRPSWVPINLDFFSYLETNNWDKLLNVAASTSANAVFIQSAYHLVLDMTRFHQEAIQLLQNERFLACGHIADGNALFKYKNPNINEVRNRYYGFHKQCLLVNLDIFRALGKPKFGIPSEKTQELFTPIRSIENIHDTYTPIRLNPNTITNSFQPSEFGWNFIHESMKNNLTIPAMNVSLRSTKIYLYPKKEPDWFMKQIDKIQTGQEIGPWENENGQTTFLDRLKFAIQTKEEINYIYNTEPFGDISTINQKFDTFITLCSGFKINVIMNSIGFNESTDVVHYDISTKAIDFHQFIIENWDGSNLEGLLKSQEYKYKNTKYESNKWNEIIQYFGGEHKFQDHWENYKKLNHTFVKLDIINDYEEFKQYLNKETLLWYSNCYAYKATYIAEGGSNTIRKKYMQMLKWMKEQKTNIWLNGNIADTNILANGLASNVLLQAEKVL
jgi:hypothetical protein